MNYLIEMKNNGNGDNHLCNRGMALPGARETAFGSMTIVNKVMSLIFMFFHQHIQCLQNFHKGLSKSINHAITLGRWVFK